jgi:hypothetical protein
MLVVCLWVNMMITVLWEVTLFSLVEGNDVSEGCVSLFSGLTVNKALTPCRSSGG